MKNEIARLSLDCAASAVSPILCRFKNMKQEREFLQENLESCKKIMIFLLGVSSLIMLLMIPTDRMIVKKSFIKPALAARLIFSAIGFLLIYPCLKIRKQHIFQLITQLYIGYAFISLIFALFTFRDDYPLFPLFDLVIIIVIYLSTILSLRTSAIFSLLYSAAILLISIFFKDFSLHTLLMFSASYFSANIVGIVLAYQRHRMIRIDFCQKNKLVETAEILKLLAYKDPLTRTYNRRAFDDDFENLTKSARRAKYENRKIFLILTDIDHFKRVNDVYGHDVGDKVIVAFCRFIRRSIRPLDRIYRFGGEEFVIILNNCTEENVTKKISSIIGELNKGSLGVEELEYSVTASFGITSINQWEDSEAAVCRADKAMYEAKGKGRNCFVIIRPELV